MKLKVASPNAGGLSPFDCFSDPDEKEISDEDDDDRNHKHRRRDTRSQSLEGDASEQVLTRPSSKKNKPFKNGYFFRGNDSQSRETWKSYDNAQHDKDFPVKFEKRRSGLPIFVQTPSDLNQRIRVNQSFSVDFGPGRGRGSDSRFSSVDVASQMIHQGSVPPSLFAGRGLSTVSNAQSAPWATFGLIPGMPVGGLDTLHSLGMQGTLRPPINPSLHMGISRQQCRDFEERGYCLRGEMCPMEHGLNRIVIEDVQGLSQFNLPVAFPSAQIRGNAAGPGTLPSAPSSTLMNSKGIYNKSRKLSLGEDGFGLNGAFSGSAGGGGADSYDPDQPLWNNDCPETSTAFLAHHSPKIDEKESLLDSGPDHHLGRPRESAENDHQFGSTATTVAPHSKSPPLWGKIGGSKNILEMEKKTPSTIRSSDYPDAEKMEDQEALTSTKGTLHQRKKTIPEDVGPKVIDFSPRAQANANRNTRKPPRKALRTLFVNGIPQENNKEDALLSHFSKFGEVIDIYIPYNSERAFVQFSKREEAEAALVAPDAVMGNRFIKLWWANRDSIPDDGISSGNSASSIRSGAPATSVSPQLSRATSFPPHLSVTKTAKGRVQPIAPKISVAHPSDVPLPASDHSKPVSSNSPKAPPILHKKLENLELLKEELRKKQEMLDQKRNDFRRQLDKLEKATGFKGELVAEHGTKKQKLESEAGLTKVDVPTSTDAGAFVASAQAEIMVETDKSGETVVSRSPKMAPSLTWQEPTNPKQQIYASVPVGTSFLINKFKLDNCPTAFRIIPPLPAALANVSILKEHFSSYGDLSFVELEESEAQDGSNDLETPKNCSALVKFATHRSAEGAFVNGKCWQGHNLQFVWLTSSNENNGRIGSEKSQSAPEIHSDTNPVEKLESSGNAGETGSSERSDGVVEHVEHGEEFQSGAAPSSCERQSPKEGTC